MTGSFRSAAADSPGGQDANAVYPLGSSAGESARLQRQADELAPDSAALLDRVGLRPGQGAIDLGCGPRGIIDLLADRTSPGGRVVGLDANPAYTAMAAKFASAHGLSGVAIVTADARHTGLRSGSFDLVHARTLLVNVPEPVVVVTEMVRLAKPGGRVAVAEPMYPPGNSRRTVRLDLVRSMRPQIVQLGLADSKELDALDAALRPHLEDPRTVAMSGLLFLVWGRKPA